MILKDIQKTQGLAKLFLLAKSEGEMAGLLSDLLTGSEINRVYERAKIFACLKNDLTQRATQSKTNAAIATVTHGAKFLRDSAQVIKKILGRAEDSNWWNKFFWQA